MTHFILVDASFDKYAAIVYDTWAEPQIELLVHQYEDRDGRPQYSYMCFDRKVLVKMLAIIDGKIKPAEGNEIRG